MPVISPHQYKGKIRDLANQRFRFLTVLERESIRRRPDGSGTKIFWTCRCDCGRECVCESSNLLTGNSKSCGCFKRATRNQTHGMTGTRLYVIWVCMNGRCSNPKNLAYDDYGGRGITVCDEWRESFDAFRDWAIAHGYSDTLTIDRFPNPNGNYEPGNCRWANMTQQARNRRNTRYVNYQGARCALAELAEQFGIRVSTLAHRLGKGWDLDVALTTPVKPSSANVA